MYNFLLQNPFVSYFFFENLIFQIQFLIFIYFFLNFFNVFYILFNFLFLIFFFSFFLAYYNLEIFMVFLLLVEFVVFFVSLMLFFFLIVYENKIKQNKNSFFFIFYWVFFNFFLTFFLNFSNMIENTFLYFLWNNYYELLANTANNDFFLLFLSFYEQYVYEFIIFGIILVVVSINCIKLFDFFKISKLPSYNFFLNYNVYFFKTVIYFLRTQNVFNQGGFNPIIKFYKKKL